MINTKQYEENIKQIETDEFSTNFWYFKLKY